MRVEIREQDPVRWDGSVAVSSPADASTPVTQSQLGEKKSLTSSLISDHNENEVCYMEHENEADSEAKKKSCEMTKEQGTGNVC